MKTPLILLALCLSSLPVFSAEKPNILLLIVDDWGIDSSPLDNDSTKSPGTTFPQMPNLQALAARGMHFTNAYAQPVCSPTRATILTGRHPFRHGIGNPKQSQLSAKEVTLPEIFTEEKSPYQLASFGKWHLGNSPDSPKAIGGWEHFSGILGGGVDNYYEWRKTTNGTSTESTTYTTTDQVNDAIEFIESHPEDPWFAWIGFNAPHTPFHNPPAELTTTPQFPTDESGELSRANLKPAYQSALQALDSEIGRLLKNVDLEKTNIILIGDNGTPPRVVQAPFTRQHAKGSLYQGGIHVPLIMAGPDVPNPGTSDKLVHCVDLFSTILDLAHITDKPITDSQSLLPILENKDEEPRTIISEKFSSPSSEGDGRAIITSTFPGYKLIAFCDPRNPLSETKYEMYRISTDINEQEPLALPPAAEAPHHAAYQALLAIHKSLSPEKEAAEGKVLYLSLPTRLRASGPPPRPNVAPTSIIINGTDATFISREDESGKFNQFFIKCSIPESTAPPYSAKITFPENPRTGDTRNFEALKVIPAP